MTISLSPEALAERFNVSRESFARLKAYVELLLRWQTRINLVGASTLEDIWTRHIADALQLLPLLPATARHVVDLGSGAGIPGLVLALAAPLHIELVESNGKKAAFLREAARTTDANVRIHATRIEAARLSVPADVVTARALAPLPRLLDLAAPFMTEGTLGLWHKGRAVEQELTKARKCWNFAVTIHPSVVDSQGVILAIREVSRVAA